MKKILSLGVCVAYAFVLVGCGGEQKAPPTTTPEQKKSMESGMGNKMKGGADTSKAADAPKHDDKKPVEPAKK